MKIGVISGFNRYLWYWDCVGKVIDEQTYYEEMIKPLTPRICYDELIISCVNIIGRLQPEIFTKNFSSERHFFGEVILYDKKTGEVLSLDEEPMNVDDIYSNPENLRNFTDDEIKQVLVLIQAYQKLLIDYRKTKRIIPVDDRIHHVNFGVTKKDINNNWEKFKRTKKEISDNIAFNKMLDYKIREIELLLERVITVSEQRIKIGTSRPAARIR
ncbi:MAG: hypothetical protein GX951_03525 [Mollicutes bacterium]|nr:hypothetical protein [Mollicutes bacterium]